VSLDALRQDLRYSIRSLRRHAPLSAVVIATLALGLGVGTGAFTYMNAEYLRARVDKDFDTFFRVYASYTSDPKQREAPRAHNITLADYEAFRSRATSVRTLAASADLYASLGDDDPSEVRTLLVTENFFSLYNLEKPVAGRLLQLDDITSANPVVVVSERLWRLRLGADPAIVGKIVHFNGQPVTVVGIAPTFAGMVNRALAWFPYTLATYLKRGDDPTRPSETPWLQVEGRLAPGFSRADATIELKLLARQQDRLHPRRLTTLAVTDGSPIAEPVYGARMVLGLTLAFATLTIFVLVVCVNVTTLLLSRAAARRHEVAVRLALGVGRGRLVRMLLTETMLLSIVAGAISVVVAYHLPRVLRVWLLNQGEGNLDTYSLAPDWRAFAYLAVVVLVAGTASGLAPALQSLKVNLAELPKGRQSVSGSARSRLHGVLIGAQVALSFFLLFSAGALARTAQRAITVDPGFSARQVLWSSLWTLSQASRTRSWESFQNDVATRVGAMRGVQAVAFSYADPYQARQTPIEVPGGGVRTVHVNWGVSPNYFDALGIPVLSGRAFRASDRCGESACPVVISQAFARALLPNVVPIGTMLRFPRGRSLEVVGVVRDVSSVTLAELDDPLIYLPFDSTLDVPANVFVRFSGDATVLAGRVTTTIKRMAPELSVRATTIQAERNEIIATFARLTSLIGLLAVIAAGLAVIGIYGVVSFAVSQRRKELGIRLALGARGSDIYRAVMGSNGRPIVIALGAGVVFTAIVATTAGRTLTDIPFRLVADPLPYLLTALLLGAMAVAAMLAPARRATRVDPLEALRHE
jgi:predicted permease